MPLKPPSSYGTTIVIAAPIDPQTSKDLTFTSRPKPQSSSQPLYPTITSQSVYPTRRPWRELFSRTSFSVPYNYAHTMARMKRNNSYFRINYTMAALFIVFLSLLWHPISMIVFLIILFAWLALYFRTTPIVLFNTSFDDRVVAVTLVLVTVVALVFTHVGLNVLVAVIVAVVIIGLHAAFRVTEDLFLDEETAAENGLVSVVTSQQSLRPPTSYTRIWFEPA